MIFGDPKHFSKAYKKRQAFLEHQKRHQKLNSYLAELVADFVYNNLLLPDKATILDLILWSHRQTQKPSVRDGKENAIEIHT